MTSMVFIDAGVFIVALLSGDPRHAAGRCRSHGRRCGGFGIIAVFDPAGGHELSNGFGNGYALLVKERELLDFGALIRRRAGVEVIRNHVERYARLVVFVIKEIFEHFRMI